MRRTAAIQKTLERLKGIKVEKKDYYYGKDIVSYEGRDTFVGQLPMKDRRHYAPPTSNMNRPTDQSRELVLIKNPNFPQQLQFDYSTSEAGFSLRIDPLVGRGPMHIDARQFTSATSYTSEGSARNAKQFWKAWDEKYPETLSAENLKLIHNKSHPLSPIVDEQWISTFLNINLFFLKSWITITLIIKIS